MRKRHLPPLLEETYERLSLTPNERHHAAVLAELNTVSDLLDRAISGGIQSRELDYLNLLPMSITAVGSDFCGCCHQPYPKRANAAKEG